MLYCVRYEKTLPPWIIGEVDIEAEDPDDALKQFYKHHDRQEERPIFVSQRIYQTT